MFKPLIAAGGLCLVATGLVSCATRPPESVNAATLLVRQDTLAENEQADLVYRRHDWPDNPGDPVTYIYAGAQLVQADEPAFVEVEMARTGRRRTYCARRFSFVPAPGRAYQVTPRFEGETCSIELTDARTGRTPGSFRALPEVPVAPLPDVPPPASVEWLD